MKVHLIKKQTILNYLKSNENAKVYFDSWLNMLKHANWSKVNNIKETFRTADYLGNGTKRVVFNIGGNHYRMICSYQFGRKFVHLFVNWIGTHAEYDKLCDKNKQYTIENY